MTNDLAEFLTGTITDAIIAPGYEPGTLGIHPVPHRAPLRLRRSTQADDAPQQRFLMVQPIQTPVA